MIMLKIIRDYELDKGESLLDRFEYALPVEKYMKYCLDKGYFTTEKYNKWVRAYNDGDDSADSIEGCFSDMYGDSEYAVFNYSKEQLKLTGEESFLVYEQSLQSVCNFIEDNKEIKEYIIKEID